MKVLRICFLFFHMPVPFLKIFHFSPDSVCRFCFSDHNASARGIAREKEKRRQPESQTSVIEGEEVEEEREEEILYSDSSVDVTADQLPVEAFLAIDLEVTPVQRRTKPPINVRPLNYNNGGPH